MDGWLFTCQSTPLPTRVTQECSRWRRHGWSLFDSCWRWRWHQKLKRTLSIRPSNHSHTATQIPIHNLVLTSLTLSSFKPLQHLKTLCTLICRGSIHHWRVELEVMELETWTPIHHATPIHVKCWRVIQVHRMAHLVRFGHQYYRYMVNLVPV